MKVCYNQKCNGTIAETEVYLSRFLIKMGKEKWKNGVGKDDFSGK